MRDKLAICATVIWALGCAGPSYPRHAGYPEGKTSPWKKAKAVEFDPNWAAKVKGELSYPQEQRAKWILLDLPSKGDLTVVMKITPVNDGADIHCEIIDEWGNILAGGPDQIPDEEDGAVKKERSLPVRKGKTYIHLYAANRLDEADYRVTIQYFPADESTPVSGVSFPDNVPSLPTELAALPPSDDTKKGGGKHKVVKVEKEQPEVEQPPEEPEGKGNVPGAIVDFKTEGSAKTRITINKGSRHDVAEGWAGIVKGSDGQKMADFTVSTVRSGESEAVVPVKKETLKQRKARVVLIRPQE